jgi:site-specific recombinase XerD
VQPVHVATYIEQLGRREDDPLSAPTIKQQLAAIHQLFDWLVVGQVVPVNPAASVRGPSHVVKKGKTPVLSPDEARRLLDSIDATTHVGLRDRALIGLMVYPFARVGAALAMKVDDVFTHRRRAGNGATLSARNRKCTTGSLQRASCRSALPFRDAACRR